MLPRRQKGAYEHDDHGQKEWAPEKVERARVGVHAEDDGLRGGAEGLGEMHFGGGGGEGGLGLGGFGGWGCWVEWDYEEERDAGCYDEVVRCLFKDFLCSCLIVSKRVPLL